jgi:hypothetical protein
LLEVSFSKCQFPIKHELATVLKFANTFSFHGIGRGTNMTSRQAAMALTYKIMENSLHHEITSLLE